MFMKKLEVNKVSFNKHFNDTEIIWMPPPDKKASRIITKFQCDVKNEEMWDSYFKWIIDTGETFLNASL